MGEGVDVEGVQAEKRRQRDERRNKKYKLKRRKRCGFKQESTLESSSEAQKKGKWDRQWINRKEERQRHHSSVIKQIHYGKKNAVVTMQGFLVCGVHTL